MRKYTEFKKDFENLLKFEKMTSICLDNFYAVGFLCGTWSLHGNFKNINISIFDKFDFDLKETTTEARIQFEGLKIVLIIDIINS